MEELASKLAQCVICQKEFTIKKSKIRTCSRHCRSILANQTRQVTHPPKGKRHDLGIPTGKKVPRDEKIRFWLYVDRSNPDGCWLWVGKRNKCNYGVFKNKRKNFLAHRISYLFTHGVQPGDLCVCHSCDNPPCVNPAHLWLGTHRDNMRDMAAKGRNKNKRTRLVKTITKSQFETSSEL